MRTFRDVKRHFSEIFEELVPGGRGELVLLTRMPESESTSGNDRSGSIDENVAALDVSLYEGIAVRVSFNVRPSPTNDDRENEGETEKEIARPQDGTEVMNMAELSGGQKALVALAIIFAIQRADPAPFYLFDEIDQVLYDVILILSFHIYIIYASCVKRSSLLTYTILKGSGYAT